MLTKVNRVMLACATALAACASVATSHAAPLAYTDGDLFLSFRATGGVGASKNIVVNIGPATTYTTATGHIDVALGNGSNSLNADLVATFGANWASRADLFWSVTGVNMTGTSFPAKTLFASRAETTPLVPAAAWPRPTTFNGVPSGKMQSMATRFALGDYTNGGNQSVSTNSATTLIQDATAANSYRSFMPGGVNTTGATAFSYFNAAGTVEQNFASQWSINDLYKATPTATTGNADYVGSFRVNADGTVDFDVDFANLGTPISEALYIKNGPVPANAPAVPAGSTWTGFGIPAINDAGQLAYVGKFKSPSPNKPSAGIFVNDTIVVEIGDAVPGIAGATFKSFKDPVIDEAGRIAFIASIQGTGITSVNDTVVVTQGNDGSLSTVAQEGVAAPGATTAGATFKGFKAVTIEKGSQPTGALSGTLIFAALNTGTGSPAVSSLTDTGVWWIPAGTAAPYTPVRLIQEGDTVLGKPLKSFLVIKNIGGSPGHGRGLVTGEKVEFQVVYDTAPPVQALVVADQTNTITQKAVTDVTIPGTSAGLIGNATAQWSKLNYQSSDSVTGAYVTTLGTLLNKSGTPAVSSANSKGIFSSSNTGSTWSTVARLGDSVPGIAGGIFGGFKDPVNSTTDAGVAFLGSAKPAVGGVLPTNNDAIFWKPASGALTLVAREGSQPPQAPAGAKFKGFASLALPGTIGPVFTANLDPTAGGITAADDFRFYTTNSAGAVIEAARESGAFDGYTLKSFNILKNIGGSAGAARSYNSDGGLAIYFSATTGETGIGKIYVP